VFAVLAADPFNYLLPEEILYPPNASYMPVDAISAELVNMLLVNPNDTAMQATNNLFGTVPNEDNQYHISTNFMDVPLQIDMSSGLVTCMYCRVRFLPPDLSPDCNS
jgi:hypothetical protein